MEAEVRVRAVVVRTVLVVAVSVLAGSWGTGAFAQATTARSLPRVYVFTEVAKPGQPALPGQEARRASVDDLREELRKKPGLLRVVDIPLDADVLVEVVRREALPGSRCLLTVRLRPAGLTTGREFQGEAATWKEAALLVADSVRRWVNENLDALAQVPRPYERAVHTAASAPIAPPIAANCPWFLAARPPKTLITSMPPPTTSMRPAHTNVRMEMNRTQGRVWSRYCCARGVRPAMLPVGATLNSITGGRSIDGSVIGCSLWTGVRRATAARPEGRAPVGRGV